MNFFTIYSFKYEDKYTKCLCSITVEFTSEKMILTENYEHLSFPEGDFTFEGENKYSILKNEFEKIVSLFPNVNILILTKYNNSKKYYDSLTENEKKVFICLLTSFNEEKLHNDFIGLLIDHRINYELSRYRYPPIS